MTVYSLELSLGLTFIVSMGFTGLAVVKARRKQQWVDEVYEELGKLLGPPEGASEEKNLKDWARNMAQGPDGYYEAGYNPEHAAWEEVQAGL